MDKRIYFCLDMMSYRAVKKMKGYHAPTFHGTKGALLFGRPVIITTSMAHLSFDLMDKGYEIFLCYKNKQVKVDERMSRRKKNLLQYLLDGFFDEILGEHIKNNTNE